MDQHNHVHLKKKMKKRKNIKSIWYSFIFNSKAKTDKKKSILNVITNNSIKVYLKSM